MATYVNDLRLKEIATGDESGTWGTSTNTNLELIGEAFSFGTEAITTNADTHTTTIADGSTDPGRSMYLKYTGTLDSACTITIGPNTVSKMWFIENGTSGSQNIIISQGSGANITIPPGDVKVIYSDGAGSGAAVVDAFASLNVVDLKVQDDLTVTDDMTVGGTLGVTGVLTATSLDISGDIDVDGTTNLDVVDIDGAVDFASTTAHAGNATFADNAKALFGTGSDLEIYHNGTNSFIADVGTGVLDIQTNGTEIQMTKGGAELMAKLVPDGAVTLYYDNAAKIATTSTGVQITGNIANASGDMTLDVAGDLILDFAGDDLKFVSAGTQYGLLSKSSNSLLIRSTIADGDIVLQGSDDGDIVTALTLDMSDAGTAIFNHDIVMGDSANIFMGNGYDLRLQSDGTNGIIYAANGNLTLDVAGDINLDADGADINLKDGGTVFGVFSSTNNDLNIRTTATDEDIVFKGSDGGSEITALTLDMSDSGTANFGGAVVLGGSLIKTGDMTLDASGDIILDADGADIILKDGGTQFGKISKGGGSDLIINASIADKDIFLTGTDGSTAITALTLDMSAAGAATFNSSVIGTIINAGVSSSVGIGAATADANVAELGRGYLNLGRDDTADAAQIAFSKNGILHSSVVTTNNDLIIKGNISNLGTRFDGSDNGSNITALRLDMSNAGTATFNSNVNVGGIGNVNLSGSTSEVSVGVSGDTDNSGGGVSFAHNTSTLNSYVLGQKVSMTIGTAISTPLLFVTNNSERWRFNSSGHFTPAQQHTYDIGGVNSEVRNIHAQGLYVGGSAAANKLDDYEEGSFTPSLGIPSGSISYSAQEGSYTKVGSVVNIVMAFGLSGISSPSGNLSISGLPFSAGHAEKFVAGMVVALARNFDTAFDNLRGYLNNGSNSITLAVNDTNTGHATPNANTLQSNTQLYVSMTYNTDE